MSVSDFHKNRAAKKSSQTEMLLATAIGLLVFLFSSRISLGDASAVKREHRVPDLEKEKSNPCHVSIFNDKQSNKYQHHAYLMNTDQKCILSIAQLADEFLYLSRIVLSQGKYFLNVTTQKYFENESIKY